MAQDKALGVNKPEGGAGKPRPTVIGAPQRQARVSSGEPGSEARALTPARPTVIEKPPVTIKKKQGGALEGGPVLSKRATVATPTAMPGVERKRMTVDLAAIRKLAPQVVPGVAERTRQLLQQLVFEGLKDREAVLWGHRLQQDYSDLVSKSLALTQDDLCRRVTCYVGRMAEVLGSVDVQAVCASDPNGGFVGQYLRRANRKIDTFEELEPARIEVAQLLKLMGEALDPLLALKAMLEQHSSRIDALGDEAQAAALAAELASNHLRQTQQALSQRFLERSMSLTQTAAQIHSSVPMRELWMEQPLRLIAAIQNGALVQVPQWLGNIASLMAMQQGRRKPTPTEAGELAYQLRNILQGLTA